jgi:RNA polymerase sporulation-specific sigma factor
MPSHSDLSTQELVKAVSEGDQKLFFELSSRHEGMIKDILGTVDITPSEKDDLYQEALIGLYKAALTYDPNRDTSFSTYAYLCIKHSIYSALRVYFSKKNYPVRIGSSLDDLLTSPCPDLCTEPEKVFIEKENIRLIKESLDTSLSQYERDVFKLFLKGLSYESIAVALSTSPKSVDNAIQRIRGKLKKFIR